MNRIYRLVRHARTRSLIPVAETARGHGKSTRATRRAAGAAAMLVAAAAPAWAADLPTGAQVAAGQARIDQSGRTLTVTQGSDRLVTNWQSFDIAPGRTVNFVQPSASAVALNRVVGADASTIQGALNANGQVFLVNPNGILFAPSAQVNVGGLVASTLNLSDSDFLAGRYRFEGAGGTIVNQGRIDARGGTIAMIAARIENDGRLAAEGGSVLLGAGTKVTLDLGGPAKLEVERGVLDALVRNGGAIAADGGTVLLTARAASALHSAVINNTGVIEARTLATGERGQILLLSDMVSGHTEAGGRLDASAPAGGDGGFIETSAATVTTLPGLVVDAGAARGAGGHWLVDPYDYTIGAAQAATISGTLDTGTSVTVSTAVNNPSLGSAGSASGSGDITVASPIHKTGGAAATLTLLADRNILVNSDIASTSGALGIVLSAANGAGATSGGVNVSANLVSNGGNISIGGAATANGAFAPVNGLGYARNLNSTSPAVWITAGTSASPRSILAGGGDITISGWSSAPGSGGSYDATRAGIYIERDTVINSGGGNIVMTGRTTGYSHIFGIGFQGGPNSNTLVQTAAGQGTLILSGWNTTGVGGAANDAGAVGLMNNGSAAQVSIGSPSVAHVLTLINGSPTIASFTYTGVGCSGPYTNCGGLQVLGTNNSYLYASYRAVDPSVDPLYILPSGSKIYDGTTAATGLTYAALGGPSGFSVSSLGPLAFVTPSRNVGSYTGLRDAPGANNPGSYTSGGTRYAVAYYGDYTITPKPVSPVAADKIYDGTAQAPISASGLIAGDQVVLGAASGSFSGAGVGSHTVNATGIALTGPDAGNYSLTGTTLANAAAQITPRPLTLSGARAYDGTTAISMGDLTLGNLVAGESLLLTGTAGGLASPNAGAAQPLALGSLALADGAGGLASNYMLAPAGSTVTITPRVLNATGSRVYDGTSAAAGADLALANLVAGETLALSGAGTAAGRNVGTWSVNAGGLVLGNGAGGLASNYTLAGGTHALAITPRPLAATGSRAYDGTTLLGAGSLALGNLVAGESLALTGAGSLASPNAGAAQPLALGSLALGNGAGGLSSNYVLSTAGSMATITPRVLNLAGSRVYDGTNAAAAADLALANLVAGETLALSGAGTAAGRNVGSQSVNAGGLALANGAGGLASNYTLAGGTHTLSVAPRPLTASGSRAYDGTNAAAAADLALTNLVAGETLGLAGAGSVAGADAGAAQPLALGSLALLGSANASASNYTLTGGALTITPRLLQLAGSRTYDGTGLVDAASLALGNLVPGQSLTLSGAGSVASPNAGPAQALSIAGLSLGNGAGGLASNYALAPAGGTVTITPRPVSVAADSVARLYGDANPALTYAAEAASAGRGLLAGETLAGSLATPATAASNAGRYAIGQGTLANPNYAIAFTPGALVVAPRPVRLTGSRVYDGTTTLAAADVALSNLVAGEVLGLAGSGRLAGPNAGAAQPLGLGTFALTDGAGGRAANYVLDPGAASATILQRAIQVAADSQSKPAGAADPALTFSVTGAGLVGNDQLAGALARDPGEAAGRYAIRRGTLANANYAISFTEGALDIAAAAAPVQPAPVPAAIVPPPPAPPVQAAREPLPDVQQALPRASIVPRFAEPAGQLSDRTITSYGGLTYVPVSGAAVEPADRTDVATVSSGRGTAADLNRGVPVERGGSPTAPATVFVLDGGINTHSNGTGRRD